LIFKDASRKKNEETLSSMLLNDVMDLTTKNLGTKQSLVYGLMKESYLKILKRIIASGREIDLKFQDITKIKGIHEKENKGVIELLQAFTKDPEKALISLRIELGLSGMNFSNKIQNQ